MQSVVWHTHGKAEGGEHGGEVADGAEVEGQPIHPWRSNRQIMEENIAKKKVEIGRVDVKRKGLS